MRRVARAVVAAAALAATAVTALADVQAEAEFGHGGGWVADAATPVALTLRNTSSEPVHVRVTLRVAGGGDPYVVEREVPLGPQATRREAFLVPGPTSRLPKVLARLEASPTVPIHLGGETADRGTLETAIVGIQNSALGVHHDGRRAIGVLFDPRSVVASRLTGCDLTVSTKPRVPGLGPRNVAHPLPLEAETLALAPLALNGFETILVCDPAATFCADPAHLDGLLDWAALGGRLVVCLGENAGAFAASPLAEHLPAKWVAGRADYGALLDSLWGKDLPVPRRDAPFAELEPRGGAASRGALLVERPFGSGSLAVAAVDVRTLLETAPRDDDVLRKVGLPFLVRGDEDPWDTTILENEFDVSGRLGVTLQAQAFRPPPLLAVLLGLVVYVAVVGPLDWLVLKRLRKERYTTFTFAGAVLVFTVLAYGVSLLLFSADAVANRVTFVELASRPGGRELARVHDLVGWYAPTGGAREMDLPLPGVVLGPNLPGLQSAGRVGVGLPLVVRGNDPVAPQVAVEVGFRSQRVVHSELAGTTGQTLDVRRTGGPQQEVEVSSTLPVPLLDAWVFLPRGSVIHVGPVPTRGSARGAQPFQARRYANWITALDDLPRDASDERREVVADATRRFLAGVVASPILSDTPPTAWRTLRRAGIVQDAPEAGRALVVAVADEPPFALPGSGSRGAEHVVICKEVELR